MSAVSIIGCGFVADLYMASLATFPHVRVVGAFDIDNARLSAFCAHHGVPAYASQDALLADLPEGGIVLNLTNPTAHFEVSRACLEAGHHVYSEKPLAVAMDEARALVDLAEARGLTLASAPCSVLGETAQTLAHAVRTGVAGTPRLVYAELDDGFIPQAPYRDWVSDSGAPWPAEDEFRTGCTLEHAGYYLTWLIAMFGSVETVVAASAAVLPGKTDPDTATPDVSIGTLFFASGMVARLTCSIVAPHDHGIAVIGDAGVLRVKAAWDNAAPVRFHRRMRIRRRLLEHPLGRRIRLRGQTHPKVGRWGAASMNFALGVVEMAEAIEVGRAPRLGARFALHLNEVTLALQSAGRDTGAQQMTTRAPDMEPMPWAT
ncbi:Gfo/Idh/MocA family protein [Pseudaestuariivita atlantica]|uniref:Oxidoreductase n=1 Tax=Pseudaestuariivita atlantica TaxID=1317121 RepID=A0A0L1JR63_9RHOB|nr:Gfo/Idh/MocA family oxidoreductase [Pseudaestuariivita atlantica]KNG93888.1 oxidoreductase [Pseudaestuariivita atlantica]